MHVKRVASHCATLSPLTATVTLWIVQVQVEHSEFRPCIKLTFKAKRLDRLILLFVWTILIVIKPRIGFSPLLIFNPLNDKNGENCFSQCKLFQKPSPWPYRKSYWKKSLYKFPVRNFFSTQLLSLGFFLTLPVSSQNVKKHQVCIISAEILVLVKVEYFYS